MLIQLITSIKYIFKWTDSHDSKFCFFIVIGIGLCISGGTQPVSKT